MPPPLVSSQNRRTPAIAVAVVFFVPSLRRFPLRDRYLRATFRGSIRTLRCARSESEFHDHASIRGNQRNGSFIAGCTAIASHRFSSGDRARWCRGETAVRAAQRRPGERISIRPGFSIYRLNDHRRILRGKPRFARHRPRQPEELRTDRAELGAQTESPCCPPAEAIDIEPLHPPIKNAN